MNHPDPKAIVERFVSFIEHLNWHQPRGGWTELPVVGLFKNRDHKIVQWRDFFDLAMIQNGFAAASGETS